MIFGMWLGLAGAGAGGGGVPQSPLLLLDNAGPDLLVLGDGGFLILTE